MIWKALTSSLQRARNDGHEIGIHAWDHHGWQEGIERMSEADTALVFSKTSERIRDASGCSPRCVAAPNWRCTREVLRVGEKLGLKYNGRPTNPKALRIIPCTACPTLTFRWVEPTPASICSIRSMS
jgi:peptidoglycan/xylan/chitin deacetylase (PgdA/CDA1 family)